MKVLKACCLAALLAGIVTLSPTAHAVCNDATLTGVWGFSVGHSVGQITFDGTGHITAESQTTMSAGVETVDTGTGTYTVKTNCTVSAAINTLHSGSVNLSMVLFNLNKSLQIVATTSGLTASGTASAEGTGTCGLTGKAQAWGANLSSIYSDTDAYVARLTLNGSGVVSGTGNFVVNGKDTNAATITGTYTQAANCTGTLTITPHGFGTLKFTYVSVNSGKELLLLETDSGTEVNGTMQQ